MVCGRWFPKRVLPPFGKYYKVAVIEMCVRLRRKSIVCAKKAPWQKDAMGATSPGNLGQRCPYASCGPCQLQTRQFT